MQKQLRGFFLFLIYTFSVLLPHGALLAKSKIEQKTASRDFFELTENDYLQNPLEPYELRLGNQLMPTVITSGHIEGRFNAQDDWEGKSKMPITLNKYLYTHGNPTSYIDPSGNFSMAEVMSSIRIVFQLATRVGVAVTRHVTSAVRVLVPFVVRWNRLATFASASSNRDVSMLSALRQSSKYNRDLLKIFQRNAKRRRIDPLVYNKILSLAKIGVKASTADRLGVPIKMNGLPDFRQFRKPNTQSVVFIKLTGKRSEDEKRANRKAQGLSFSRPRAPRLTRGGYAWHHHEVVGIMELVDQNVHSPGKGGLAHDGGAKFWEILRNKIYR